MVGPPDKVAAGGHGAAEVVLDFLENIYERGGIGYAVLYGEAKSVRLAGFVVGVLAEDDHFYPVEGAMFEGVEDVGAGRVNGVLAVFLFYEIDELVEIFFFKFGG